MFMQRNDNTGHYFFDYTLIDNGQSFYQYINFYF